MNTRSKSERELKDNNFTNNQKDRIRQLFSQNINNTKTKFRKEELEKKEAEKKAEREAKKAAELKAENDRKEKERLEQEKIEAEAYKQKQDKNKNFNVEEDQNNTSSDNTSFLSSSSQIVSQQEIEEKLVKNNTNSEKSNYVGDLSEKTSSSELESFSTKVNSALKSTKNNNPIMGNGSTDERIDKLVGVIEKLATEVAEGRKNEAGKISKEAVTVLGSLEDEQLSKLNLKITEVEAVKVHPWLVHAKRHDTKIQKLPTELAKIEDKTIRKCIYSYIRNEKDKITDYQKLLLMTLESDPEVKVVPSFLVRMVNYLDEEKLNGTVSEAKFLLKVAEIDRCINKEEMENLRRQLTQGSNYYSSSSKTGKSFSSWAGQNKRIDKYAYWKEKYPDYKSLCLDFNCTGTCKRGEGCQYKHVCLRCHNTGEGPCDKPAKICEEQR